jgi:hypothetical protein
LSVMLGLRLGGVPEAMCLCSNAVGKCKGVVRVRLGSVGSVLQGHTAEREKVTAMYAYANRVWLDSQPGPPQVRFLPV